MIFEIYKRAFNVLMKKPLRLWGISLLSIILSGLAVFMFGLTIGVGICINLVFEVSMLLIYLNGYRGKEVHVVQIFEPFKSWNTVKRICCGMGWEMLWIFLWGLIPFVGWIFTIIRGYEYYLTPYILALEPNVPQTEAINVSRQRMHGNKLKLFLAQYIWKCAYILVVIILAILIQIPYIGVLFELVAFVVVMSYALFGTLFAGLVNAAFYEELTNPTIPADAPLFFIPMPEKAVPQAAGEVKFCPECGAKNAKASAFCSSCGWKFEVEIDETQE